VLWRRYRIHSTSGAADLYVEGRIWRPWRFPIVRGTRQVACIKKKWSGVGKEMFTDADNFTVAFEDPGPSADERMLILATAMAIDYDFFEKRGGD